MNPEVTDLLGRVVKAGDIIAAAFRTGNVAELRVGTITGFGERGNNLTIEVGWIKSSGFDRNTVDISKNGAIEADLHRFIKIGG